MRSGSTMSPPPPAGSTCRSGSFPPASSWSIPAPSFASYNSWRTGVGIGGPVGNTPFSYRFDASRNSTDGWLKGNQSELYSITGAIRYDVTKTLALTLYVEALHDHLRDTYGTPTVN